MAESDAIVVVGAGLAAASAVQTLRQEGYDGRIVLVGDEPVVPYDRPPLSKDYLRGGKAREDLSLLTADFYETGNVELVLGRRASAVDTAAQVVHLEDGVELAYSKLLIATGCGVRRLSIPGADLDGVYYLRSVADADAIAQELQPGRRLVVVGAGFIGLEVAACAVELGLDVCVLEMESAPLKHALGSELGELFAGIYRARGIDLRLNEGISSIEGEGRAGSVTTSAGEMLPCDLVVVGIGVLPQTQFLDASGIAVENGILTDEYCRTNVADVYAAGDVAHAVNPALGRRVRLEHWSNAQHQGSVAALNMLGKETPCSEVPWFWSDQFDLNIQLVGVPREWDTILYRGDVTEEKFSAFYIKDKRLLAALAVNRGGDIRPCREIIAAGGVVDLDLLQDEATSMRSLMPRR